MRAKRTSLLVISILALAFIVSACSGVTPTVSNGPSTPTTAPTAPENITLTLFDKNVGDSFTNPVAKIITEKTGIYIEVQQPSGNPDDKLNLMLASGDLPDIVLMDRRGTVVNKYIAAGALISLNDLIEQYGQNIKKSYGDVLVKSRYKDGKNYYLNNWYGLDPDPNWAFNMRLDLLKEFGYGDKALKGEPITQMEFIGLLNKFIDTYPKIGAKDSIPLTFDSSWIPSVIGTFKGMYGLKLYYEVDNQIMFEVRNPQYLEMVKFVNNLYSKGLLDKEWGINKTDITNEKLLSERVFACGGGIPNDANRMYREKYGKDTDKQFYAFNVTAPGVAASATTYGPRSTLGWDAVGITVKNKHPVETMKFLEYLSTEEGQYLLMWGLEGVQWDIVDGKHTPRKTTLDAIKANWAEFSKTTGVRKWTWVIKNGLGTDGTPFDLCFRYERDVPNQIALTAMQGTVWDTAPYDNLGPAAGTPEAVTEQKIKDIIDKGFSDMVYAASTLDLERIYNKVLEEIDSNNAKAVESIYTSNYKTRLELWK